MKAPTRVAIIHAFFVLFAVALVARAAKVQVAEGKQWVARGKRQHFFASGLSAPRGQILDASGNTLVERGDRAPSPVDRSAWTLLCRGRGIDLEAERSSSDTRASARLREFRGDQEDRRLARRSWESDERTRAGPG